MAFMCHAVVVRIISKEIFLMASLSDDFWFFSHAAHLSLDDLVTGPLYFQGLLKAGASKSRKGSNVTRRLGRWPKW
jgi:hypothetical protein